LGRRHADREMASAIRDAARQLLMNAIRERGRQ